VYELEHLLDKFKEHAIKAEENNKRLAAEFLENNPGEPLPDHFTDDFNLCTALASICHEILMLKGKMATPQSPKNDHKHE
jgi:hypothetical protein